MAGVAEHLGHSQWSGCSRQTSPSFRSQKAGATRSLLPRARSTSKPRQCAFSGNPLRASQKLVPSLWNLHLLTVATERPFLTLGSFSAASECPPAEGSSHQRVVRAALAAEYGAPLGRESAQKQVLLGGGPIGRTVIAPKNKSMPGLSRKATGGELVITATAPAAEHAPCTEQNPTMDRPSRKKGGSPLDTIRTKVLHAPENGAPNGAPKPSPNVRRMAGKASLRKLATVLIEPERLRRGPKEPSFLMAEPDAAVLGERAESSGGSLWADGDVSEAGPGADVSSLNGAFWAVAAAASRIANGVSVPGVVSGRGSVGSSLERDSKQRVNGTPVVDGVPLGLAEGTAKDGQPKGKSLEPGSALGQGAARPTATVEMTQRAGASVGSRQVGLAKESAQRARGKALPNGTAFEDGVMAALRKKGPIVAETRKVEACLLSRVAEERKRREALHVGDEEGRKDSGQSASTSGRDAAPARKVRKTRVSPAMESLIEQALSEGEAVSVAEEAPARKTRKRVQKVVSVEEAPVEEGERPKRVRKRVRVRSAEVGAETTVADGVESKVGCKESVVEETEGERLSVDWRTKVDARSFKARQSKVPALGAALLPVNGSSDRKLPDHGTAKKEGAPVRRKGASGAKPTSVPSKTSSELTGAASKDGPQLRSAVQSLGDSGPQMPRLATQTVGGTQPSKLATSQVALGPIDALRASASAFVPGGSGAGLGALKAATIRVGEVLGDPEQGLRAPKVAKNQAAEAGPGALETGGSGGGPKLATMKVPLGPIAALRAAASTPVKQLTPAVASVDESLEGGPLQALRSSGRHAVSAAMQRGVPLDYLSDLEEGEDDIDMGGRQGETGPIQVPRSYGVGASPKPANLDFFSDLEDEGEEEGEDGSGFDETLDAEDKADSLQGGTSFLGARPPLAGGYYSNHLLESHRKTETVWSRGGSPSPNPSNVEQFDYSIEPAEAEELVDEPVPTISEGIRRKRRRGRQEEGESMVTVIRGSSESARSKEQLSVRTTAGAAPAKPNGDFLLMYASWRDVSEGRLDPAGYEVVSAKTGVVIGVVTAFEPLKTSAEKEMEETGLQLHTGVLRMTAAEEFIDEFERGPTASSAGGPGKRLESDGSRKLAGSTGAMVLSLCGDSEGEETENTDGSASRTGKSGSAETGLNTQEEDGGESDWEEIEDDSDVLASLDEMTAALGAAETGGPGVSAGEPPRREYTIPVIGEYIDEVSVKNRRITVVLPGPLDRISRRPAILRGLGMTLYRYCSGKKESVKSLAEVKEKAKGGRVGEGRKRGTGRQNSTVHPQITYMPTEKELLSDGREDILEDIQLVGGFSVAMNALGLSRQKRPIGFWENKLHLDAEIELFNYSRWTKQTNSETGEVYWVNLLNDMVAREKPPPPGSLTPPLPVSSAEEDADTACMPKRKDVTEAGRWDLHHAIVSHGGYTAVARELGRQTCSRLPESFFRLGESSKYASPEMLIAAVRKVMEEKNLTKLPSIRDFKQMGREDIIFGFRRHGGLLAVAEMMKVEPKAEPKRAGRWTLESAAAALNEYIEEKAARTGEARAMPTLMEVQLAGKSSLRYVMQHFGQKVLAEQLGLPPNLNTLEKQLRAAKKAAELRAAKKAAELKAAELRAIRKGYQKRQLLRLGNGRSRRVRGSEVEGVAGGL